jgi:hypothetical protein
MRRNSLTISAEFSLIMTTPRTLALSICLILAGCAAPKQKTVPSPAAAAPEKAATVEFSVLKKSILSLARREWDYFGRQTVLFDGEEESIPHVGKWEDDEEAYAFRVNQYWRAVGKPELNGNHCSAPWSAAFISWVMQEAGVPEYQFTPAEAHWVYLSRIMTDAGSPDAAFVPRPIDEYSPQPGDLVCATRGNTALPLTGLELQPYLLEHAKLHCDIVVERQGDLLAAIGGNVRNSVSKTMLKLSPKGLMQPTSRRPWFMVLENRL